MKEKKQTETAAPQPRKKPTRQQRLTQILLLVGVVLILVAIWVVRLPKNYVNMFLGHFDGTTSVVTDMKGVERSDEESALLLPLEQGFDDWKQTHLRDEVSVTGQDGSVLRGGYYDAHSDVTVILLHTFDGSSTDSDYLFAAYYADKGYNILLPDSRDHGESEGALVTYGLLEGGDVVSWIRWLKESCATEQVILHGETLGANSALAGAAAAEAETDLAGVVKLAVAESPVVNLYDAANYLLKNQFRIPGVMVSLTGVFAKQTLGTSMKDVDLTEMTQNCRVPVLLLQGSGDTVIDPASVAAFGEGYAGEVTSVTPDCAHGMVYATAQQECEAALDTLISENLD